MLFPKSPWRRKECSDEAITAFFFDLFIVMPRLSQPTLYNGIPIPLTFNAFLARSILHEHGNLRYSCVKMSATTLKCTSSDNDHNSPTLENRSLRLGRSG